MKKRVLFDTNVLLDVLLAREPHLADSARAVECVATGDVQGFIAAHAITTLFYLLQRQVGAAKARAQLGTVLERFIVAPVTDEMIRSALIAPFADFEDAVTVAAALGIGAHVVVTRNLRDFEGSSVPAVHPGLLVSV